MQIRKTTTLSHHMLFRYYYENTLTIIFLQHLQLHMAIQPGRTNPIFNDHFL
jgi:hypothetical protein